MFFYYDTSIIILIPAMIFAMAAQGMVKSNFSRYGKVRNGRNMTGAEAARRVLDENGLRDVAVRHPDFFAISERDISLKDFSASKAVAASKIFSFILSLCGAAINRCPFINRQTAGLIPAAIGIGAVTLFWLVSAVSLRRFLPNTSSCLITALCLGRRYAVSADPSL